MLKKIIATMMVVALSACSDPLSYTAKNEFTSYKDSYISMMTQHNSMIKYINDVKKGEDWKYVSTHWDDQQWNTQFTKLKETQKSLSGVRKRLNKIREDDDQDQEIDFRKLVKFQHELVTANANEIGSFRSRIETLIKAQKDLPEIIKSMETKYTLVQGLMVEFAELDLQAQINYEFNIDKIKARSELVHEIFNEIVDDFNNYEETLESDEPNYLLISNIYQRSAPLTNELMSEINFFKTLENDELTILDEVKTKRMIVVGRTTWEENYYVEFPRETTHIYQPHEITEQTYKQFVKITGGFKCRDETFKKPGFCKTNWADGDNSAEYWIEDLYIEYWQKQTSIVNGSSSKSEWVLLNDEYDSVPEARKIYHAQKAAVGMQISSKKRGYFDDEFTEEPIPVGLDRVGDKNYGEWKSDSSGKTFWHYYGQYSFFNNMVGGYGSPYYSSWDHNYYRDRDRNRYGYYGNAGVNHGRSFGSTPKGYIAPAKTAIVGKPKSNVNAGSKPIRSFRNGSSLRGGGSSPGGK